jgi:tetratricopeptide (TPR) repeat protein
MILKTGRSPKLLLIGWDAAEWDIIHSLMDAGAMPVLKKMIQEGVFGRLSAFRPLIPVSAWVSAITGVGAKVHGVRGPNADAPLVENVFGLLSKEGLHTHQICWPGFPQSTGIPSVEITTDFLSQASEADMPWPLTKGIVSPPYLADTLAGFRIHPSEITGAHLLPFLPQGHLLDQSNLQVIRKIKLLRKQLADSGTIQAVATWLMESRPWDCMALHFGALRTLSANFMQYHPPRLSFISDEDFYQYSEVITAAYRFQDMMLGGLLDLAGPDTNVILFSPYGFLQGDERERFGSENAKGRNQLISPEGFVVMRGPGIRSGLRLSGGRVTGIAPTLLALFELPLSPKMDASLFVEALHTPPDPGDLPDRSPGEYPDDPEPDEADEADADITEPEWDPETLEQIWLVRRLIREKSYEAAIDPLQGLCRQFPERFQMSIQLADCFLRTGRIPDAESAIEGFEEQVQDDPKKRSILAVLKGRISLAKKETEAAIDFFKEAEKQDPGKFLVFWFLGKAYRQLSKWEEAAEAFAQAEKIRPQHARSQFELGFVLLQQRKLEAAVKALLKATETDPALAQAHYHLGDALYRLGEYQHAVNCMEILLDLRPDWNQARNWAAMIYEKHLDQPERAKLIRNQLVEKTEGARWLLSGYPAEGVQLLSDTLATAGLPVFQPDPPVPLSVLDQSEGKLLQVPLRFLTRLTAKYRYRVLFVEMETAEFVSLRHQKLIDAGKVKPEVFPMGLQTRAQDMVKQINKWFGSQSHVSGLRISYRELQDDPVSAVAKAKVFLDQE